MKIAIFTDAYLPYTSGVAMVVDQQAKELASRGHELMIFCPKYKNSKPLKKIKKISTINLPLTFPIKTLKNELEVSFPIFLKSLRYTKEFNPDIIHCHTEFSVGWEGMLCSKLLKIPLAGTFHTFFATQGYLKNLKLDKIKVLQKIAWNYSISFFNKCDVTISPCKTTAKELRKNGLKSKLKVISNGLNIEKIKKVGPNHSKLKNKYNLGEFNIIFVGRLFVEKSIDILLESFRMIQKEFPETKLIIIGKGPEKEKLISKVKDIKIEKNVVFTGKIKHEELINSGLIKACDIFVTASKTENQPLTIMEAMANGLPIVGVRKLGLIELVEHNVNGYLAKPDDPSDITKYVMKLIKNPKLREKMAKNSELLIKNHDMKITGNKLEILYSKLSSMKI